jgi:hypothetical protein
MPKTHCEICDRNFKNEEALEMHNKSKHTSPETNKEKTKIPLGKIIGFIVVIGIVFLLGLLIFNFATAGSEYKEFAQCLTDSGTKMYGAYWCPACAEQKDSFGKSWKYVDYIECSLPNRGGQTQKCNAEGIQSYPTWEFPDGQKTGGVISLSQLSQITGCELHDTKQ